MKLRNHDLFKKKNQTTAEDRPIKWSIIDAEFCVEQICRRFMVIQDQMIELRLKNLSYLRAFCCFCFDSETEKEDQLSLR